MSNPDGQELEKRNAELSLKKLELEIHELKLPYWRTWLKSHGIRDGITLSVATGGLLIAWYTGVFDARGERLRTQELLLKVQEAQLKANEVNLNEQSATYKLLEQECDSLRKLARSRSGKVHSEVTLGSDIESYRLGIYHFEFNILATGQSDILSDVMVSQKLNLARNIRCLESLAIRDLEIGKQEMIGINALPRLRRLYLRRTNLSDETIDLLASLGELDDVVFDDNPISSLRAINRFSTLKSVSLIGTKIDDDGLKMATTLKQNVVWLNLDKTAVTDAAVEELLQWRRLEYLGLCETKVTSAGLLRLADHPTLIHVYIELSRIPESARDAIVAKKGKSFLYDTRARRKFVPSEPSLD